MRSWRRGSRSDERHSNGTSNLVDCQQGKAARPVLSHVVRRKMGMPIEAAREDRVERGGWLGVSGTCRDVNQVVRILAGDDEILF